MASLTDPKFAGFDLLQTTYKTVGDHAIRTDIIVPQAASTAKQPIIVRFHGGGLAMGDSLFADFWPQWLSDLALQHHAVILSPNYRLMPQATGLNIYNNVEDFWAWVRSGAVNDLLAAHSTPSEADLLRILVAAVATYPSLDVGSVDFSQPQTDLLPFGQNVPKSVVDSYVASLPKDVPVSSAVGEAYLPLMLACVEHGRLPEWYKRDSGSKQDLLYPARRLEKPDVQIPTGGITIIQGRQDSVVPAHHSEPFVPWAKEVLKGKPGGDKISLVFQEGEHGFDGDIRYDEPWLHEALQMAVRAWLA
ncbi:Alpha/Beta hydrolase protein [Aspergillus carlsbadensis]|nr:Alpha/Beta hydrolase protein [Aspergillus carlsbadensis]